MKQPLRTPLFVLLILASITFVALGSFWLVGSRHIGPVGDQQKGSNEREHESPPEDWFVTQRVTHGGIPAGAMERAAAQAVILNSEMEQSSSQQPGAAKWIFAGPTNIGGRVVDIAVDPVAADTLYIAAATGGVDRPGPGRLESAAPLRDL